MTEKTIFQKVIDRKLPSTIVYEDDDFIAFHDINPVAPVHVLLVPKEPYRTLEVVPVNDPFHGKLLTLARQIAKKLGIAQNYQLHLNVGDKVQQVPHLHLHIMGGWNDEEIKKIQ